MLHDPSHYEAPPIAEEIKLAPKDTDILRRLAADVAAVAALPVHKEKARLWRKLNDLASERPMVWINEICWHEMDVDGELTLQTSHPWARDQERDLRRTLYQWRHLPADMVVSDYLACPLAIHSTDFGIMEDVDVVKTDAASDVVSRHFNIQIRDFADLDKIQMPKITHNEAATEFRYRAMCKTYDGIMPVRKVGQTHIWFTPWDYLIRWWGIQEAMIDLVERPELICAGVERMVDAWMAELDQFVAQNLLSLDCDNTRIGSGGYGYTSQLPGGKGDSPHLPERPEGCCAQMGTVPFSAGGEYDPNHVQPHNMWGCSNAQIFSEVSPRMHWEFALKHDLRWLSRWGLTYYGCCEPLDQKIDILRKIPNLRKISVSPWCNTDRIIEKIGADYVMSRKPSPAILAEDNWHPERAREEMRSFLAKTGGKCHVELIMKDISTVHHEPRRLWQWAEIAMEVAEEFAGK